MDEEEKNQAVEAQEAEETVSLTPEEIAEKERKAEVVRLKVSGYLAIILGIACVAAIYWIRPRVLKMQDEFIEKKRLVPQQCVARAEKLKRAGLQEQAFKYLQYAVIVSLTDEDKAVTGLAMGQHLLEMAEEEPKPYGIMAKQYITAALKLQTDSAAQVESYRALMKLGGINDDMNLLADAARKAQELTPDENLKVKLLLHEMDAFIRMGDYRNVEDLISRTCEYSEHPTWKYDFLKRNALLKEQILARKPWFRSWLIEKGESPDFITVERLAELRDILTNDALADLSVLKDSGVEKVAVNAMFHYARILVMAERYQEAQELLYDFLSHEPDEHQSETMFLMAKIIRSTGGTVRAGEMMTKFFERFSWNSTAADEMLLIIDQACDEGRAEEALELINKYIILPAASKHIKPLLAKAGQIAMDLGLDEEAEMHYIELLSLDPEKKLAAAAMLQRARIHEHRDEPEMARVWLARYLNHYPSDESYGDALFELLDNYISSGAEDADIISTAISAANRSPQDPRALESLMMVAEKLEKMGLPTLAQRHYNKISLLHYVTEGPPEQISGLTDKSVIARAMLGNARCILQVGDEMRADHMFRELCNSLAPGRLRSEAAYHWAVIASKLGQKAEAKRRLDLVEEDAIPMDIKAKAAFERLLIEIESGARSADSMDVLVEIVSGLPLEERKALTLKAYSECFGKLLEVNDVDGARGLLSKAAASGYSSELPLNEMSLLLAKSVLAEDGVDAFINCLKDNEKVMSDAGVAVAGTTEDLVDMAREIKAKRAQVEKYL